MIALRPVRAVDILPLLCIKDRAFADKRWRYMDCEINPDDEKFSSFVKAVFDTESDYYCIYVKTGRKHSLAGAIQICPDGENTCSIAPLFIAPEYQGYGIGSKVLQYIYKTYPDKNIILTATMEDKGVISFYEKNGFRFSGKSVRLGTHATLGLYELKRK